MDKKKATDFFLQLGRKGKKLWMKWDFSALFTKNNKKTIKLKHIFSIADI